MLLCYVQSLVCYLHLFIVMSKRHQAVCNKKFVSCIIHCYGQMTLAHNNENNAHKEQGT